MKPTTTKLVAGAGILSFIGYVSYIRLSMYLGRATVDTNNYLLNENNQSFFLDLKVDQALSFAILPKFKIYKINLIVGNEKIATSTKVLSDKNSFSQEFVPIPNANFLSLTDKKATEKSVVEVCYKTFLGLPIKKRYEVVKDFSDYSAGATPGNGTPIIPQESCACENLKNH